MGAFEDFVNKELPKRIATDEDGSGSGNLPTGKFLRTTGIGLLVETVDAPVGSGTVSGIAFIPNALVGADGITVTSGVSVDTISGFRTEFVNASGSLAQALIDHTAIPDAHHEQTVINTTAFGAGVTIIGGGGTSIVTSGTQITISGATASGVVTDHAALDNLDFNSSGHIGFASLVELLTVSGHLQSVIDAVEASDVDSINAAIGDLFIVGAGEVDVTTVGQTITISGTPHAAGGGTISDAIIGGVGITVTSGSNITTIDGHLRYTSAENPAIVGGTNVTVVSGVNTITLSSTGGGGTGTISDALIGVDGITVTSGSNTTTISGFRTEFVNASGSLQVQIDNIVIASGVTDVNLTAGSLTIDGAGEVFVTTDGQTITVSGTPHTTDTDTISDAIIAGTNITVVSGTDIITISSTAAGGGATIATARQVLCRIGGPFAEGTVLDLLNPGSGWEVDGGPVTFDNAQEFTDLLQIYRNGQLLFPGTTVTGLNDAYFVAASGSFAFQSPILTNDIVQVWGFTATGTSQVIDVNGVSGSVIVEGAGEVIVTTSGQTITVSGTPHPADKDTVSDALAGVDGITIISGTNITTVSGFRDEFLDHAADPDAHHTRYTKDENDAILGGVGITVSSGSNEITIDGHLRYTSDENDAIIGVGEVVVTSGAGFITISGTEHETDKDTISDAIVGGVGITVTSGAGITTIDGHEAEDAIIGADGITIISGTNTTTVSGFRDEFVSASGSLQTQIDAVEASDVDSINGLGGTVTVEGVGEVFVTTAGQTITVSGTPHLADTVGVASLTASGVTLTGSIILDTTGGTTISVDEPNNTFTFDGDDDFIRTITVATSGSVVTISGDNVTISGVGGVAVEVNTEGVEPFITVSGEPLPTTSGQAVQPDPDGDLITINRARFGYGKNGNVQGAYLRVESASSSETGHVMMRPARITGVAAYYPSGASEKRFEIRKNGDSTTLLEVVVEVGVPFVLDEISLDFDLGDRVQVFVTSSGTSITDPNFWGEVGWRAE